jgi:hypothetical protein
VSDAKRERARFRSLFERVTGMQIAHYARPRGWAASDPVRVVHADGHTFAVLEVTSATGATVHRALTRVTAACRRLDATVLPLIVVPLMGPTGARLCDESGVAWIDAAGNARIRASGLRIHIEGRPDPAPRRGRPASAFAARSARIARLLLRQPDRWRSQAALARESGLGPGFVSRIVSRLEQDGLVRRNAARKVRPADPGQLLDAWKQDRSNIVRGTVESAAALGPGESTLDRVVALLGETAGEWALGGTAGARWVLERARWPLVDVWVEALPDSAALPKHGMAPTSAGVNVRFLAPKDAWVLRDRIDVDGIPCVTPLQLYLDLPEAEAATPLRVRLRAAALGGLVVDGPPDAAPSAARDQWHPPAPVSTTRFFESDP